MRTGDVDIEAIGRECIAALEARRADVLCPAKDGTGRRCMLSFRHAEGPTPTPHRFE